MNGFENEYEFVKALNNKKVKELNPLLQDLIYDIFYNIDKDDLIKAWRNHYKQKGDILIKINNRIRTISIKMGSRNSVHIEPIDSFIKFLRLCDIDEEIITEYLKYHYADSTINGTGNKRLSAEEYKKLHQKEIDKINNALNTENTLISALNRFVILGRNSYYPISAIVHVTPTDFFYLKIEDIKEINIKHLNETPSFMNAKIIKNTSISFLEHNNLNYGFITSNIEYQYYYMQVSKGEEGELMLHNKRQKGILIAKLVNKNRKINLTDINEYPRSESDSNLNIKFKQHILRLNYSSDDTKICENDCYMLITYYKEIPEGFSNLIGYEYTILSRVWDYMEYSSQIVNIPFNEYLFGIFYPGSITHHY